MNLFQRFTRRKNPSTVEVPTISSLKSEELWQFIQRPEGQDNSDAQAKDYESIWAESKRQAMLAELRSGEGSQEWALNSH